MFYSRFQCTELPRKFLDWLPHPAGCPFGMPCHIAVSLPRGDSFLTRCLLTRPSASPGYACASLAGASDENGRTIISVSIFYYGKLEQERNNRERE